MENTAAVKRWGAAAGLAWLSSLAFSLDVLDPVARAKEQTVEGMALTVLLAVFYHWAMEKTPADSRQQRRMLPLAALLGLFTLTGLSMEASDSLAFTTGPWKRPRRTAGSSGGCCRWRRCWACSLSPA